MVSIDSFFDSNNFKDSSDLSGMTLKEEPLLESSFIGSPVKLTNPVIDRKGTKYCSIESDSEESESDSDSQSIIFNKKDPNVDYTKIKDTERKKILDTNYNQF